MSSIGRSGGSDEVNQLKLNFAQREAQREKVHEDQVAKIRSEHEEQITHMRETAKSEMDELREKNQERFTEREKQYLRDIESIKAVYQKKLVEKKTT